MSTPRDRWKAELAAAPPSPLPNTTVSGVPVAPLYTPDDLPGFSSDELGYPGQYPFTRGVHASMYRSRLWTMRQFAGFGTARQTNERFKFLLEKGQTGLSTAFAVLATVAPLALGAQHIACFRNTSIPGEQVRAPHVHVVLGGVAKFRLQRLPRVRRSAKLRVGTNQGLERQ